MKKYKIYIGNHTVHAVIEEVEVERETENSVWIKGRRIDKFSSYMNYYSTREAAKAALLAQQKYLVEEASETLERRAKRLKEIEAL